MSSPLGCAIPWCRNQKVWRTLYCIRHTDRPTRDEDCRLRGLRFTLRGAQRGLDHIVRLQGAERQLRTQARCAHKAAASEFRRSMGTDGEQWASLCLTQINRRLTKHVVELRRLSQRAGRRRRTIAAISAALGIDPPAEMAPTSGEKGSREWIAADRIAEYEELNELALRAVLCPGPSVLERIALELPALELLRD